MVVKLLELLIVFEVLVLTLSQHAMVAIAVVVFLRVRVSV